MPLRPWPRSSTAKARRPGGRPEQQLEREIEAAEVALAALEDELADPAAWSGAEASARSAARHDQAKRAVEELYEQWERIAG